jgi:hypothetical protein
MIRILSRNINKVGLHRSSVMSLLNSRNFCEKIEKSEEILENSQKSEKLSGFAKAFEKYSRPAVEDEAPKVPDLPFATLLRQSKLMDVSKNPQFKYKY